MLEMSNPYSCPISDAEATVPTLAATSPLLWKDGAAAATRYVTERHRTMGTYVALAPVGQRITTSQPSFCEVGRDATTWHMFDPLVKLQPPPTINCPDWHTAEPKLREPAATVNEGPVHVNAVTVRG